MRGVVQVVILPQLMCFYSSLLLPLFVSLDVVFCLFMAIHIVNKSCD